MLGAQARVLAVVEAEPLESVGPLFHRGKLA
jgi:hypothetical protein